jgi:nucleoside-diphosphate-sugar epimerase
MTNEAFDQILVIGGSGFVGQNLIGRLAAEIPGAGGGIHPKAEVVSVSGRGQSVRGAHRCLAFEKLAEFKASPRAAVVFLAAHRYNSENFLNEQSLLLKENTRLIYETFDFCAKNSIREIRATSSIAIYPAGLDLLSDEVHLDLSLAPLANEAFYAWSKRNLEIAARLFFERYKIGTHVFRLSNPYGGCDSIDFKKAHVLPAFVMKALSPEKTFEIKGDPSIERDFVFVDDVTEILMASLSQPQHRGTFEVSNVASGKLTTIGDLARHVCRLAGVEKEFVMGPPTPNSVRRPQVTNKRVQRLYGKTSFLGLDEGLRKTIEWYRRHV